MKNHLLESLTPADHEHLNTHLSLGLLQRGTVLYRPGRRIYHAYFPVDAAISIASINAAGQTIEAGLVGREGFVGLPSLLEEGVSAHYAIVQVPGSAYRVSTALLKSSFDWSATFRTALLRYAQYYITQVSQTAVCNRSHNLENRLARWLLGVRDAIGSDEMAITQEVLSQMLGTPRPGVTIAVNALADAGAISHSRGRISIEDTTRLRALSCDCYGIVRREQDRLVRPVNAGARTTDMTRTRVPTAARATAEGGLG